MPDPGIIYDEDAETYTMTSAGHDIWDTQDGFAFAYMAVDGDFSGRVRLDTDFTGPATSAYSKAVLMVRDSLTPGSKHASYCAVSSGFVAMMFRDSESVVTDWPGAWDVSGFSYPIYLRLDRVGDTFTGYHSTDGEAWTVGSSHSNPNFSEPVYLEIALTSQEETNPTTMVFSHINVPGYEPGTRAKAGQATFALVSEDGGELASAGIELVLRDGRRLRIAKGVDEETLRTVIAVLRDEGC